MAFYDAKNYSSERSVGFLTVSIASLLGDELEGVLQAQLGLGLSPWRALAALYEQRADTAAELCTELHHDSGAMTRLIAKLEALGLITRVDHEHDRRTYKLKLTRQGRTVCERGYVLARDNLNESLAGLGSAQCEQLIAMLQTVKSTLLAKRAVQPEALPTAPPRRARKR